MPTSFRRPRSRHRAYDAALVLLAAAAEDAAELVACARRVPGVRDVENRFSVHAAS